MSQIQLGDYVSPSQLVFEFLKCSVTSLYSYRGLWNNHHAFGGIHEERRDGHPSEARDKRHREDRLVIP